MKIITGAFATLLIAANSLIAWSYYYPENYGSYEGYSYPSSWQDPSSYDDRDHQQYNDQNFRRSTAPKNVPTKTRPQYQEQYAKPHKPSNKPLEQQYSSLIIMFTKDQCPYCVYMKPIMKKVENKFGKDIKFIYVDIVKNPGSIAQYGFSTVPHIVYFKDGKKQDAHGSDNKTMTTKKVEEKIKNIFGDNTDE